MKKKIVSLVLVMTMILPLSAVGAVGINETNQKFFSTDVQEFIKNEGISLTEKDLRDPSKLEFILESKDANEKLKNINEEIRRESDFEVFLDNGKGIMAYTNAKNVVSATDKARFLGKVEKIEAQKSVTSLDKVKKLDGYMENKIEDDVTIDKPWFGGTDTLKYSGTNTIQWFKEKSKYENWTKLTGVTDLFTVGYSYVSNTTTGVSVGISSGTIPSPNGSASFSWTVSNTKATQSFTWPEKGSYFYYGKTYGTFTVESDEITNYTHQSYAIANVGGENVLVNTQASTTF